MKVILHILMFVVLSVFTIHSFACKEAALNESLPITDFKNYDTIVIATITGVKENTESRYGGYLSFEATIKEAIKGSLPIGTTITGQPTVEQPKAVCPTTLINGSTYILLLTKQGNIYSLSRFSFPTNSQHVYYSRYVNEIKERVNSD